MAQVTAVAGVVDHRRVPGASQPYGTWTEVFVAERERRLNALLLSTAVSHEQFLGVGRDAVHTGYW